MNSVVLPPPSFSGISSVKEHHPSAFSHKPLLRKSLIFCGIGLALSAAFYWGVLIKTAPSNEPSLFLAPPNQAIYEWTGFHRIAPTPHFEGLNPL